MIGRTNTGGGGSIKGTDAILRVIAPAGSTVTISKGGVSKSDLGHENASDPTLYDYYFVVHQSQFDSVNAWTVTATLGASTVSDTVIIDTADEYDVVLLFNFFIYDNGTEKVAMESIPATQYQAQIGVFTAYSNYFNISTTGANHSIARVTSSAVDLTDYNLFVVRAKYSGNASNFRHIYVANAKAAPRQNTVVMGEVTSTSYTDYSVDISTLSGSYYLSVGVTNSDSSANTQMDVTEMYLSI